MLDISNYIHRISQLITSSDNIVLICHTNPDGDAIGSTIALYDFIKSTGKNVNMVSPNYIQEFLKWMDGCDLIYNYIKGQKKCRKIIEEADLIIMLDLNHKSRIGDAVKTVMRSKATKILVDHHADPENIADVIISDSSRCATSELVFDIVKALDNNYMSSRFAEAVYVGIVTDTGNFEFGQYTGHTFRIVASLLETGIDKEKIRLKLFNNFSVDRMKLMRYALYKNMIINEEYHTAYIFLSKEELLEYNYAKGDTEGFVNLPLTIGNIYFSALIIEKDDFVKFSFRSKGDFSVNEFASKYFSGGGHKNASGGEFSGTLEDAVKKFEELIVNNHPCIE